jgi:hypothetical protein
MTIVAGFISAANSSTKVVTPFWGSSAQWRMACRMPGLPVQS